MAELSKFQKFEMRRMNRKEINGAPYNPRRISESAKKKLRANLKDVGLLGPLTVNTKTGNLVSGHQRLAALDALEGTDDYTIDVAIVSLSPKREREQNLFMNNAGAMGEWDIDALAAMLPEIKLENTGFDAVELEIMFSGTEHESFFAPEKQPENVTQAAATMFDMAAARQPGEKSTAAKIMAEARAKKSAEPKEQETDNFAVAVFPTVDDRERFVERLGYDKDERYISGERLAGCLK